MCSRGGPRSATNAGELRFERLLHRSTGHLRRARRPAGGKACTTVSKNVVPQAQNRGVFVIDSPIGPLGVAVEGETVVGVRFGARPGPSADHPAATQLTAY